MAMEGDGDVVLGNRISVCVIDIDAVCQSQGLAGLQEVQRAGAATELDVVAPMAVVCDPELIGIR